MGDGEKDYINGDLLEGINIVHEYREENSYFIRIFGCKIIRPYWFIKTIHSIGNMDNLSNMFSLANVTNEIIGKNWDVSNVTSMRSIFSLSHGRGLAHNIGKTWNTINVIDMFEIFHVRGKINKLIGKYWNISDATNISGMFGYFKN